MTAAHIQFAVITEAELTEVALEPYQALVIPHSVCLPDIDLGNYKGKIIATGESGTRDACGQRRSVPLFAVRRSLKEFAVEELVSLPAPLRVLAASSSLLIRALWAEDGMLVHIVNCGGAVKAPVQLAVENMVDAKLFSPDFPEEVSLNFASGKIVVPAERVKIYAVVHILMEETLS